MHGGKVSFVPSYFTSSISEITKLILIIFGVETASYKLCASYHFAPYFSSAVPTLLERAKLPQAHKSKTSRLGSIGSLKNSVP
jgi:hypothetical protein